MTRVGSGHYNNNCLPTFHGGDVLDAIVNYLEKYSSQVLFIQIGFIVIIGAIFVWVWYYNRKKYNHLKHQIPASIVKSYLDSIIQNSTALKSSLFRGGGLDVDPNNIPSVMPVSDLPAGAPVNVDTQELSSLRAQIAQLQSQLDQKQNIIKDLENAKVSLEGDVKAKQARIEELEKLLAKAQTSGGEGSSDAELKLVELAAERDKLKETLAQYEVIEDDLANLKRLKQENEQLKKALQEAGGAAPVVEEIVAQSTPEPEPEVEPEAEVVETPEPQETQEEETQEPEAVVQADSAAEESEAAPEKSPEDLLSEFEKMLG